MFIGVGNDLSRIDDGLEKGLIVSKVKIYLMDRGKDKYFLFLFVLNFLVIGSMEFFSGFLVFR